MKANSTNILIEDATFYNGEGIALGSIGQYKGQFETIENITVRNVVCNNTKYATRVKTWTGDQVGYPPNGGGGGLGCKFILSAFLRV
jgi:polygalacturonase